MHLPTFIKTGSRKSATFLAPCRAAVSSNTRSIALQAAFCTFLLQSPIFSRRVFTSGRRNLLSSSLCRRTGAYRLRVQQVMRRMADRSSLLPLMRSANSDSRCSLMPLAQPPATAPSARTPLSLLSHCLCLSSWLTRGRKMGSRSFPCTSIARLSRLFALDLRTDHSHPSSPRLTASTLEENLPLDWRAWRGATSWAVSGTWESFSSPRSASSSSENTRLRSSSGTRFFRYGPSIFARAPWAMLFSLVANQSERGRFPCWRSKRKNSKAQKTTFSSLLEAKCSITLMQSSNLILSCEDPASWRAMKAHPTRSNTFGLESLASTNRFWRYCSVRPWNGLGIPGPIAWPTALIAICLISSLLDFIFSTTFCINIWSSCGWAFNSSSPQSSINDSTTIIVLS
mmetsp:Transcript_35496/g.57504  ORF Transcript_35496/g.57504 Transcript_35496/m.57504 type:complete len:399 (+) Transcript_35496:1839-3035(+)